GDYAIKDVGLATCKLYAQEQKAATKRYFQFVGWVTGYLSAHNRYAEDNTDIAPWQSTELLAALIGSHCKSNPGIRLVDATNQLINALYPTRLRTNSKKIKAVAGGKAVFIYEAILRRAQQMLAERGHFTGAADGKFGPATQQAFESFQKERKLAVTGLPDQRSLLLIFQ
ncbi:MAG: peptidoglycan-binding domain-containing protein, partial [Alphaproteobacteria bacterium]